MHPEPTSIENTFRFIKAAYLRKLKRLIKQHDFNAQVRNAVLGSDSNVLRAQEIFETVVKFDPDKEPFLKDCIGRFQFKLILNQFRKSADAELGDKITTVCNRHFYSPFEFWGRVDFDERVIDSIYARKLYIENHPDTATALKLRRIAELLAERQLSPAPVQQVL